MPADRTHRIPARDPLLAVLARREPVGLADVLDTAARLERVDRKYLVDRTTATAFLDLVPPSMRVLTIDGRLATSYSSVYFDTPRLDACRDHVQQRRRRWKVRSRLYVEDGLCRFEVKTRSGRGLTTKAVAALAHHDHGVLTPDRAAFVEETLREQGIDVDVADLAPSMTVGYHRATLADTVGGTRATLDWDVLCRLGHGRVWVDPDWVLIETKGDLRPGTADRVLATLGARPRSFSKYVSAASLLRDDIADNDVRRLRGRQLHARVGHATDLEAVSA